MRRLKINLNIKIEKYANLWKYNGMGLSKDDFIGYFIKFFEKGEGRGVGVRDGEKVGMQIITKDIIIINYLLTILWYRMNIQN